MFNGISAMRKVQSKDLIQREQKTNLLELCLVKQVKAGNLGLARNNLSENKLTL